MNLADNSKMFYEAKNGYIINYIVNKKDYPYYILTDIIIYKNNNLCIKISSKENRYNNRVLGNEYKSIEVETINEKRIIEFDLVNRIISDRIISNKNTTLEVNYYENELFDGDIIYFFLNKSREYRVDIERKKSLFKRLFRK